jgi:imidazolonepropionase-like amidohydrolase
MPRDISALNKLVNKKITLILNVHRASDILKVIEIKEQYDIDVVISGGQESWMVAKKLATASIPIIIDPMNNIPNSFDQLGARSDTAALLEKAGVKVMFTVPRDHNYHLIRQGAGNAVANGMSYDAAINGLSGVVSDVFHIKGRGKLKKGFYADLVIWDGDPLEPASMPTHVIINGEISDLTSRSSRLMERYTSGEDKPNTYR